MDWRLYFRSSPSFIIAGEDSKSAQERYNEHRKRMSQMYALQRMYRELSDMVTAAVLKRISVTLDATAIKQLEQAINSLAK